MDWVLAVAISTPVGGAIAWGIRAYMDSRKDSREGNADRRQEESHARQALKDALAAAQAHVGTVQAHLEDEKSRSLSERARLSAALTAAQTGVSQREAAVRATVAAAIWATAFQALESMSLIEAAMKQAEAEIEEGWEDIASDHGVEIETAKAWLPIRAEKYPPAATADLLWMLRLQNAYQELAVAGMRQTRLAKFAIYVLARPGEWENYEDLIREFGKANGLSLDPAEGGKMARGLHEAALQSLMPKSK